MKMELPVTAVYNSSLSFIAINSSIPDVARPLDKTLITATIIKCFRKSFLGAK